MPPPSCLDGALKIIILLLFLVLVLPLLVNFDKVTHFKRPMIRMSREFMIAKRTHGNNAKIIESKNDDHEKDRRNNDDFKVIDARNDPKNTGTLGGHRADRGGFADPNYVENTENYEESEDHLAYHKNGSELPKNEEEGNDDETCFSPPLSDHPISSLAAVASLAPPSPPNSSCTIPPLPSAPSCEDPAFTGKLLPRKRKIVHMILFSFEVTPVSLFLLRLTRWRSTSGRRLIWSTTTFLSRPLLLTRARINQFFGRD